MLQFFFSAERCFCFFSPTIKIVGKKVPLPLSSLVLLKQFYSNYIISHQLYFQPTHFKKKTASSCSFSDNPPMLEIGHNAHTHTLTNLLILLHLLIVSSCSHHGSSFLTNVLSILRSLFPQYLVSGISSAKQVSSHHCTDYSDVCLFSRSVSLCLKTVCLASLSMLTCQIMLNEAKTELISFPRALHNCIYHHGHITHLSNS